MLVRCPGEIEMREEFEKWVTSPPFEMPIERLRDDSAWPGCYKHIAVDLAWRAWQEAAKLNAVR